MVCDCCCVLSSDVARAVLCAMCVSGCTSHIRTCAQYRRGFVHLFLVHFHYRLSVSLNCLLISRDISSLFRLIGEDSGGWRKRGEVARVGTSPHLSLPILFSFCAFWLHRICCFTEACTVFSYPVEKAKVNKSIEWSSSDRKSVV